MGEVIMLSERREAKRLRQPARLRARTHAEFFFDLACPFTYLAAERIERSFDEVIWRPAAIGDLRRVSPVHDDLYATHMHRTTEQHAAELRLPLVWPERFPAAVPAAMRIASHAAEAGRGGAFVLAATRLAFCGGFDLDDPEILAEAASAAGIVIDGTLDAARDAELDAAIAATGRSLAAAGAGRLPALRLAHTLYWGESRVGDALAAARVARVAQL